jgi:hypothetical protein
MLSKGRIMQGIEFLETAKVDLGAMGIRTSLHMVDRHSPLSYAIVQHINWDLSPHRGAETCAREFLENVHIIQGATLCREVGENFPRCAIKRKKYLEAAFGPIRVSWPLHHLSTSHRPVKVYVQGRERNTRSG